MLDISQITDLEEPVNPKIMGLLTQFRRIQISLFPLIVTKAGTEQVNFYDSRFPINGEEMRKAVAKLWIDTNSKKEDVFVLHSKAIDNPRFRNERRSRKITGDPAKMLKYLKTYVLGYDPKELAAMTKNVMADKFEDWRYKATRATRDVVACDMQVIYEEVKRMADLGLRAQTAKFQKIIDEGLALYEESKYVESRKDKDLVHLFFNPDDSINLWFDARSDKTTGLASHYASFDDLPEQVATRAAMLKISEIKTFIPDVGIRVDDRSFWVDVGGRY
jgi:hypothetical protein